MQAHHATCELGVLGRLLVRYTARYQFVREQWSSGSREELGWRQSAPSEPSWRLGTGDRSTPVYGSCKGLRVLPNRREEARSSLMHAKDNPYSVPSLCFCNSLRCGAYGTFCYGISQNVVAKDNGSPVVAVSSEASCLRGSNFSSTMAGGSPWSQVNSFQ